MVGRLIAPIQIEPNLSRWEIKMIDFILAGIAYVGLMFVVLFCICFATIGICYGVALFFRRCERWLSQPHLVMK
jgi:hypothetical protein